MPFIARVSRTHAEDAVQTLDVLNDADEISGDQRIAVVGELDLTVDLIPVDVDVEGLLDLIYRAFRIDHQTIGIAGGNGESLTRKPVNNCLFILRRRREARVPLLGSEPLMEVRRILVLELLQEFLFLRHLRRSNVDRQAQFGGGIIGLERAWRYPTSPARGVLTARGCGRAVGIGLVVGSMRICCA